MAEQTAREGGHEGFYAYNFNDPEWKAKYLKLSKIVLEEYTDRIKVLKWLDVERNVCPYNYVDL